MKIKNTGWLTRQNGLEGWKNRAKIINAALSQSVLKEGNNSSIINLDANHAVVLRVLSHEPKHQLAFSEVKSSISYLKGRSFKLYPDFLSLNCIVNPLLFLLLLLTLLP